MRWLACLLALHTTAAQAASLCGVTDPQEVLEALAGDWTVDGATSVETETVSDVDQIVGSFVLATDARFASEWVASPGPARPVTIAADSPVLRIEGAIYNVDQIDDMLDTVEADWIADDLSETPCGPEGLPQLTHKLDIEGTIAVRVTVIPYFTDAVLLISEAEMTGDWGLAFVTTAALLTPAE